MTTEPITGLPSFTPPPTPQNWFEDNGWYERLLLALRELCYKHRDCLVTENSDEIKTVGLVMADMARHSVRQLGEGPYVVMHGFGREELPHLGAMEEVVETSSHGVTLQGVGQDRFGFHGVISVHRLPARLRAVQLYQYADGGPPPMMAIMLLDDALDLRPSEGEQFAFCDQITVA